MIDIEPRTRTVTVGTVTTQYATLEAAMKAYSDAMNAARPAATVSPRKVRRLAQIAEARQGGQR